MLLRIENTEERVTLAVGIKNQWQIRLLALLFHRRFHDSASTAFFILNSSFSAVCQEQPGEFNAHRWKEQQFGSAIPLPEGLSQLSYKISVRPRIQRIPVPGHGWPPVGEAFMMLCGQHHVPERKKSTWSGRQRNYLRYSPASLANPVTKKSKGLNNHAVRSPLSLPFKFRRNYNNNRGF